MQVVLPALLQERDDRGLLFGVDDAVDDPALFAGLELRLVVQHEAQVRQRLADLVAGRKIVAEHTVEHECVSLLIEAGGPIGRTQRHDIRHRPGG
jgi:hypothetical protein